MIILTIGIVLLTIHHGQCSMKATAVLYADNSDSRYGMLTFSQQSANDPVRVTGSLSGLNISSAHGFHVHVYGVSETFPNCTAAGGHFNPYSTLHGPREAGITQRHVGDLGNITTDASGSVNVDITDSIIQLYNETQSIVNRTIVVHRMSDDGGQGGFTDSTTTGHAGARVLCGRIILSNAWSVKPVMLIYNIAIITVIKLFY